LIRTNRAYATLPFQITSNRALSARRRADSVSLTVTGFLAQTLMFTMARNAALGAVLAGGLLLAGGCAAPAEREPAGTSAVDRITGTTWEWTGTVTPEGNIEVAEPARYTIRLTPGGEARIRYDCNHGGSFYEIDESSFSFGPLTATRVPCPDGSQGPVYMRQLGAVTSFFTRDGDLFLGLGDDSGAMRFRAAGD